MKLSLRSTIEIILDLVILVCMFVPYLMKVTPFNYAFSGKFELTFNICVSLPLLLFLPFLLLLILQNRIKPHVVKIFQILSLLLYATVFGTYIYIYYYKSNFFNLTFTTTLLSGLFLLLTSLIFSKNKTIILLNTILATIAMPFVFHMPLLEFNLKSMEIGGLIIQAAFILLYVIGFVKVFKAIKKS